MLNCLDTRPDSLFNQSTSPHGSSGSIRTDGERSTPSPSELNKDGDRVADFPSFPQKDDKNKIFSEPSSVIFSGNNLIQSSSIPSASEWEQHGEEVTEHSPSVQRNDHENKNLLSRQLQAIPSGDTLVDEWTDTEQTPRVMAGSPGCHDGDVASFISSDLIRNPFIFPEGDRVSSVSTGDSSNENRSEDDKASHSSVSSTVHVFNVFRSVLLAFSFATKNAATLYNITEDTPDYLAIPVDENIGLSFMASLICNYFVGMRIYETQRDVVYPQWNGLLKTVLPDCLYSQQLTLVTYVACHALMMSQLAVFGADFDLALMYQLDNIDWPHGLQPVINMADTQAEIGRAHV